MHRKHKRRGGYDAHSRYGHQAPAGVRLLCPGLKGVFGLPDADLGFAYLLQEQDQHSTSSIGQMLRAGIAHKVRQLADIARAPPCYETELSEMTAYGIDQLGALT